MAAAVRLRSAVALLGGFPVLAGADLDVRPGEVVLLQGANGAGKTSLLRTCAGLLPIVSGRAEVLGCDLTVDRRAVRRRVGLLGHATALYDDLTVEDNVRFAVRAAGGATDRVEPALVRLGLGGRLRSVQVGRLSAGQRRRTALAALVARQPELWLLDEPHAGLDAEHRDLLDDLIRHAVATGAAVLMASHERERASALADRALTMAGGLVIPARRSPPATPAPAPGLASPAAPAPASGLASAGATAPAPGPDLAVAPALAAAPAPAPGPGLAAAPGSAEGETGVATGTPAPGSGCAAPDAVPPTTGEPYPAGIFHPLEAAHVA